MAKKRKGWAGMDRYLGKDTGKLDISTHTNNTNTGICKARLGSIPSYKNIIILMIHHPLSSLEYKAFAIQDSTHGVLGVARRAIPFKKAFYAFSFFSSNHRYMTGLSGLRCVILCD